MTSMTPSPAFILYRLGPIKPNGKRDKVPVHPDTLHNVNKLDRRAWLTHEAAQARAAALGEPYGVGVVIHEGSGLFFFDADSCVERGVITRPEVAAIIDRFRRAGGYVEGSVSGTGVHGIASYEGAPPNHANKNSALGIELYSGDGNFCALTGIPMPGTTLGSMRADATNELWALALAYFQPTKVDESEDLTDEAVWPVVGIEAVKRRKPRFAQLLAGETLLNDASNQDLEFVCYALESFGGNGVATLEWLQTDHGYEFSEKKSGRMDYYLPRTIRKAFDRLRDDPTINVRFGGEIPAGYVPLEEPPPRSATQHVDVPGNPAPEARPPTDVSYSRIDRTGQGNANLLVQLAGGNLRYVAETDQWLRWTNERWEVDTHESFVTGHALQVSKHYHEKANRLDQAGESEGRGVELMTAQDCFKYAAKCRNKKSIDEMISLARKIPGVAISVQDLDRKRHLLGVANGVVNLKTGKLQADAREDYVTMRCAHAFNPDAKAPRFMLLIKEVTGFPIPPDRNADGEVLAATVGRYRPRPTLATYLVRVLGYCTTGEIKEHKFFIFTGNGSNGKNVVMDAVRKVLGPYAQEVPSELLLARAQKSAQDAERPTPVVAGLKGVRMAVFSETTDGQKLDQGIIKKHVGQDTIRARGMRENGGEQQITHKSTLVTNHLPKLDHLEPAIKDRIANLPFDRRWNRPGVVDRNPALPDADPGLADYLLENEAEGILAELVNAAGEYYAVGLKPPQEVVEMTTEYFNANDALGHWVISAMEPCAPTPGGTIAADLFKMFSDWCAAQGREVDPSNQTALGIKLGKLGYESKRGARGMMWGLRKKPSVGM